MIAGRALQVASLAVLATPALASPDPAHPDLSFQGATLGMSLDAWRALPPPDGPATTSTAICSAGAAASPAKPADRAVDCVYRRTYGRFALQPAVTLPDGRRVTDIRYSFRDGRLAQIAYRLSVDAYESTVARLDARFGSASRVLRDTVRTPDGRLARVTRTWTAPGGVAQLVDPVAPYAQIEVRLSGPAVDAQAAAGQTH
ncbi:MAG: hypothetical protein ACREE0_10390 [Phenylobacterium sp.]